MKTEILLICAVAGDKNSIFFVRQKMIQFPDSQSFIQRISNRPEDGIIIRSFINTNSVLEDFREFHVAVMVVVKVENSLFVKVLVNPPFLQVLSLKNSRKPHRQKKHNA